MATLSTLLRTLFYPLPARAAYGSSTLLPLIVLCAALLVAAYAIRVWRSRMGSALFKKLSKSWGTACFWFAVTGFVLIVARGEGIQYVAMRFWWVLWALAAALFVFVQIRLFRARHYEIIPTVKVVDARDEYLPKAKKH